MTDVQYFDDMLACIKEIGNTYYRLYGFRKQNTFKNGIEIIKMALDQFLDENGYPCEGLYQSFYKNPFLLNTLALKILTIYSMETEVFNVINKV